MSSHTTWAPFPGTHQDLPGTLLIGFTFANDGYSILMTDLANTWAETLSRRELCIRALNEDTSIDPTGGSTQLKIFMDKIRSALDQTSDEHSQTSLTLVGGPAKGAASDQEDMVLRITCVLPKPLKPLQWPINLQKRDAVFSAEHMILPLLRSHRSQQERNDKLVALLREKDAVITKLVDKLEAMGTSLDNVFPTLSGKKKVTREAAEQKIKGLVPFDESEMPSHNAADENSSNALDLVEQVFGSSHGFLPSADMKLVNATAMENWWKKLDQVDGVTFVKRHPGEPAMPKTPSPGQASGGDDDSFQVQSTPPHLMSAKEKAPPTSSAANIDDDSTEDEDPSQIPDSHPPPRKSPAKPKTNGKSGRLGVIGGKRAAPPPPKSPSPEIAASKMDIDDDETASEAEEKAESPPPPPSPPKASEAAPKRGGIGRIGGKHKASSPPVDESSNTAASTSASQDTSKPTKHRLGHIGGKSKTGTDAANVDRGRQAGDALPAKRQEARETSLERADRKRAELQKELERKAAAGPVKKKRKF